MILCCNGLYYGKFKNRGGGGGGGGCYMYVCHGIEIEFSTELNT